MIEVKHSGSFKNIEKFLAYANKKNIMVILDECGRRGLASLVAYTPVDTGETANSWSYSVNKTKNGYEVVWSNSNISEGTPVAILLQYGHAGPDGTYVQGHDYINPALRKVLNEIAEDLWKEVTE